MTWRDLLEELRVRLDDAEEPYLWKDSTLLLYLQMAEVEACRRALILVDSVTLSDGNGTGGTGGTAGTSGGSLCKLPIIADQSTYSLSSKILRVNRVKLDSQESPLTKENRSTLDLNYPGWQGTAGMSGTSGNASTANTATCIWFPDSDAPNVIGFYGIPVAADTATITVTRLPLASSASLKASPEIPDQFHLDLLDWACHLAYLKNDSDTLNLQLSATFDAKFTQRFGPAPNAYTERLRRALPFHARMRSTPFGT